MIVPCRAVLFDLDGVLVDSRASVQRAWGQWADSHGIEMERVLDVMHGVRSSEVVAALAPDLDAEVEGEALDRAQAADREGVVAVPGAAALLAAVAAWTVVTSGRRELAEARLGFAGLPVPADIVCAEDIARGKPAPDGYRLGAERLGYETGECVVIEDAPAGVAAARAGGMRVIGVSTTHEPGDLEGADAVVTSLEAIGAVDSGLEISD